ncbi:DUF2752 domain-containing protein [Patulibacter sp. S7RM1-6]
MPPRIAYLSLAAAIHVTCFGSDAAGVPVWRFGKRPIGSLCLFRRLTGVPCPGCGMTRASVLITRGHAIRATRANPAVWLLSWYLWRSLRQVGATGPVPHIRRVASATGVPCCTNRRRGVVSRGSGRARPRRSAGTPPCAAPSSGPRGRPPSRGR